MRLSCNVICLDLSTALNIDEHQPAAHVFNELDMGYNWVCLCKAQNLYNFTLLYPVHPDLTYTILHILHVDQIIAIKVKRHTILGESHIIRSVLHKHVFFKVTDADRVQICQWSSLLRWVAWDRDRQNAIILLV